jgi:hypothetical protein
VRLNAAEKNAHDLVYVAACSVQFKKATIDALQEHHIDVKYEGGAGITIYAWRTEVAEARKIVTELMNKGVIKAMLLDDDGKIVNKTAKEKPVNKTPR